MAKKATEKVTKNKTTTTKLLNVIVEAMQEKKANEIVSLNLGKLKNPICRYFVICSANSNTQVSAIADNIEEKCIEKLNEKVWKHSGFENSIWIVLDYSDIVVHIFQTDQRNFYKLEELWADAELKTYEYEKTK